MKSKKNNSILLNGCDILVISIIVLCVVSAITVWIWYGYKDVQIEHQLLRLK